MSKPTNLPDHTHRHLDDLTASCPEMTTLATRVREFAAILTQRRRQDLAEWITTTQHDTLPGFGSYLNGLEKDWDASVAGLTLPYNNGPTEGVNTKSSCSNDKPTAKPASPYYLLTELNTCITPGQRLFVGSGSYSAHGSNGSAIAGLDGYGRAAGGPSR